MTSTSRNRASSDETGSANRSRPRSMKPTQSARRSTSSMSCEETNVRPVRGRLSAASSRARTQLVADGRGSRPVNGSSRMISWGRKASAERSAAFMRMPRESVRKGASAASPSLVCSVFCSLVVPRPIEQAAVYRAAGRASSSRAAAGFPTRSRCAATSRTPNRRESTPSTCADPPVGRRRFISSLIVVVLPAPFGPISAKMLPEGTRSESPSTASTCPESPRQAVGLDCARHTSSIASTRTTDGSSPVAPDGAHEIAQRHAISPRFDDEPLRGLFEESAPKGAARLSRPGDHRSDSRSNREQSIVYERRDDPVGRVGIDLELLAQRTHGGECVAGAKLFGHDCAGDRVDDLLVDGDARRAARSRREA